MRQNVRLAFYPPQGKDMEAVMVHKLTVISLIVICITILIFTWMIRDSLCELTFKQGDTEVAAIMVYES